MNEQENKERPAQPPFQATQSQQLIARRRAILRNFSVADLDNPVTLGSIRQILELIDQKLLAVAA